MLTDAQVAHFRTFGFLVLPKAFSAAEMDGIRDDFDAVMESDRDGQPFDGTRTQTVLWFVEQHPRLAVLAEDDRIYGPIGQLLGEDFIWVLSDGNLYVGDTQWHGGLGQSESAPLKHIKVAIYPDAVTRETGALRVIPGSHVSEYQEHLRVLTAQYEDPAARVMGLAGAEVPSVALESNPGDVVFFSESLWHAAFGGHNRRMFTLIYCERPNTPEQVEWLEEHQKRTIAVFHPHESFLQSERPKVRRMVDRYVELGLAGS